MLLVQRNLLALAIRVYQIFSSLYSAWQFKTVADLGYPRRRLPPARGSANQLFDIIFAENCMKMKEIGRHSRLLDTSLQSHPDPDVITSEDDVPFLSSAVSRWYQRRTPWFLSTQLRLSAPVYWASRTASSPTWNNPTRHHTSLWNSNCYCLHVVGATSSKVQ